MRRRRILLVIPALSQGGAERQLLELGRRLLPRFDVTLCTFFEDGHYARQVHPDIKQVDLGLRVEGRRRAFGRLVALLENDPPDLVQSFMDQANLWVRLAALCAGPTPPPIVTSVRGPWMSPKYSILEGLLSTEVGRAVIVNSKSTGRELLDWVGVPRDRLRVVHNFVDFDVFQPRGPEARARARRELGLADDALVLLVSGRLSPQKHHLGLALALGRLRRQGRLPENLVLLFAGRPRDRWYARLVPPAMRRAGVASQVRALGVVSVEEVPRLYAASDVLLLPSLWEGLANVALEAQACGLPVVASDKANVDDIVAHGETGLVAPLTLGMRPYAEALGQMLALSPEARAAMGQKARERVRRLFDPDRALQSFLGIYDAVLANRPLPALGPSLAADNAAPEPESV